MTLCHAPAGANTQGFVTGKDGSQTYRWELAASFMVEVVAHAPATTPTHLCSSGLCRNEQRFEEQLPHGYRKAWRLESVTYFGAAPSYAQLPQQQQWGLAGAGLFAAARPGRRVGRRGCRAPAQFPQDPVRAPLEASLHCLDWCTPLSCFRNSRLLSWGCLRVCWWYGVGRRLARHLSLASREVAIDAGHVRV